MAIKFSRKDGIFTLTTKNTAYAFQIAHGKYPIHIYYGKKSGKITPWDPYVISFSPYLEQFGNTWSPDVFPQEYSFFGAGDFRTPALRLKGKDGNSVTSFDYKSYRYIDGTAEIPGLPQARAAEDVKTLCVTMEDKVTGCLLNLYYTVFYECDVITRHIELINNKKDDVVIEKCMSMTLDLPGYDYIGSCNIGE
jgi:alpha-galactosidase